MWLWLERDPGRAGPYLLTAEGTDAVSWVGLGPSPWALQMRRALEVGGTRDAEGL